MWASHNWCRKLSFSVHLCRTESRRQSFVWSREGQLYYFATRRGAQRANALKTVCPNLEGVVRSCIILVQRGRDQHVDILLIGWWWGKWESTSSTFWFQLVWGLRACGQRTVLNNLTSPTWRGFQYLQNSSKILLCVSLEGEPGPSLKAALLFLLTVGFSLVSHPFPSLP